MCNYLMENYIQQGEWFQHLKVVEATWFQNVRDFSIDTGPCLPSTQKQACGQAWTFVDVVLTGGLNGCIEHFIFCFVYVLYISCMYINIFNIYSFVFIPIPKFDFHNFTIFLLFFTCFLLFFLLLFFFIFWFIRIKI